MKLLKFQDLRFYAEFKKQLVRTIKNKMNTVTKNEKITKKILVFLKVLLIASTAVYPLFMDLLSGIGWISTYSRYGSEFTVIGTVMVISSGLMSAAVVLCLLKKNISAVVTETAGFAAAMTIMIKMMNIADERGWSDMYTMQPASDMYRNRILPTVIPFVLLIAAAVLQYFSYDEKVKRRLKREEKEKKENMPAPKILGD